MVTLPEFYKYSPNSGQNKARPILASEVPKESGLLDLNSTEDFENYHTFDNFKSDDIISPLHPDFPESSNPIIKSWTSPGPVAGPYYAELDNGSTATYYWYKFNEQPSILNSTTSEEERALMQERVERIHSQWSKEDSYIPELGRNLASIDNELLLTPPTGLEVGYVPICVHQQLTSKPLPNFPTINKAVATSNKFIPKNTSGDAPLRIYILAGQSNTQGQGTISPEDVTGTLDYMVANDSSGKYDVLVDQNGDYKSHEDVWMYYERDANTVLADRLTVGFGAQD